MSSKQLLHLCLAMAVILAGLAVPLVQPSVAFAAAPNIPSNVSPSDNATGVSLTPTLMASPFGDSDNNTFVSSWWQICTDAGSYDSPLYDLTTGNVTSIVVPSATLTYSAAYYWHVRYQDSNSEWSAYSAETSFSTLANQPPGQPSNVSPANLATVTSLTPTLQSSAFSDDVWDTHVASQWQITATEGNYAATEYDSGTDSVNLTTIVVPALAYSTTYYWHVRYQDNNGAWSAYSAEWAFTTPANQPPGQPSNVSPASGGTTSITPTLQSSAFSDDVWDTHAASQWQATTTAGNYAVTVFDSLRDTSNLTAIVVPALAYSTTYYWHVRYQDNNGAWSAWSEEWAFTTSANLSPNAPANSSPVDLATGVILTPTLMSSSFSDPDAGDTHTASQWQITTTAGNYALTVFNSVTNTPDLTSTAVPSATLAYSTTYYWHVRHQDNNGAWSAYSAETWFTTSANQAPATPTNVSPNAETVAVTPTLTASAFSDPGDTHAAAQWQIRSVTGTGSIYNSPVFDSGTDNVNLTAIVITVAANLKYSTIYFWHVRYRDNNGAWSGYSAETWFLTSANQVPNQPVNSAPADGAPDQSVTPTLGSSAFVDPDAGDTHLASQWQIAVSTSHNMNSDGSHTTPVFDSSTDSVNMMSLMVPSSRLTYSTIYYWHVRHQDNNGAWSAWSAETSFTTAPNQPPGPPTNSLPANLATGVSLTPTLQSSDFNDPGDTHTASQWQITTVAGNYDTSLVFDNVTYAPNLTSTVVPSGPLSYSTTYYWRVRHQDGQSVWSEWSSLTSFTTAFTDTTPPTAPVVTDDGASTTSLTELHATWTSSDPESGIVDYQYAIGTTAGGTDVLRWTSVGASTEVTRTGLTLTWGAAYYFSVKAKNGQGAWSSIGSSNGIQVTDATSPSTPVVTDDGGSTTSTSQLHATWTSDDPESGINRYQYAIGTTAGGTDVVGWTSVGTSVAVTRTDLTLTVGVTYFFSVRARNEDGLWSGAGVSDGILVSPQGKGQGNISAAGGTVQTADGKITARFPADVVVGTVTVTIEEIAQPSDTSPPDGFEAGDPYFVIEVTDASGKAVVTFSGSIAITVRYSEADMAAAGGNPRNLVLAYWDEVAGEWKAFETRVNTTIMTLSASTSHPGTWAVLARTTPAASGGLPPLVWLLCFIGVVAVVVPAALILARKWFSLKD